jgi:hypothetical protein
MKKYFLFLSVFLVLAFNNYAQDNTTTLKYIDASNNKLEACLILNSIEQAGFDAIKEKLEQSSQFTIVSDFIPNKKFASFTFKSKSNATILDFEKLVIEGTITQLVYNNKLIGTTQISQNYKQVNRTETISNKNFNSK